MTRTERGRLRRRVTLALLGVGLCWAGLSFAQEGPRATCRATLVGGRVLVDVELAGFLDPELLRLVRLGLEGRLSFEVSVVRRRRLWFDAPVETQSKVASLRASRATGKLWMNDRREVQDPAFLALERVALHVGAEPEETYGVEVTARLQVVTASSLDRLAGWISGRGGEEKRALPHNVLQAVAEDLSRVASGRCEARRRQPLK